MKDLLVIVPSRGRPENFARLCEAFQEPTRARLLVCQDDDDVPYEMPPSNVSAVRRSGPRQSFARWLDSIAVDTADEYPYLASIGDDHMPRTNQWADRVVYALQAVEAMHGAAMVYTNDLFQGPNMPTAIYMSSTIVQTLGYMTVPGMDHFVDVGWLALGQQAGILWYLDDVIVEHIHPAAKKAPLDKLYDESGAQYEADMAVYRRWATGGHLEEAVAKLAALHPANRVAR